MVTIFSLTPAALGVYYTKVTTVTAGQLEAVENICSCHSILPGFEKANHNLLEEEDMPSQRLRQPTITCSMRIFMNVKHM